MFYVIKAYENRYKGLHGVVIYSLVEANSDEEAQDLGIGASYEIMEIFGIDSDIANEIAENGPDLNATEFEALFEKRLDENVGYELYRVVNLDEDFIREHFHGVEDRLCVEPDDFIKEHCVNC